MEGYLRLVGAQTYQGKLASDCTHDDPQSSPGKIQQKEVSFKLTYQPISTMFLSIRLETTIYMKQPSYGCVT
jgi:hypothetical protein